MESCSTCEQKPVMCSGSGTLLCPTCIPAYLIANPDAVNFLFPCIGKQNPAPNFEAAREIFDNLEKQDQYMKAEQNSLERVQKYRNRLPSSFELLKGDVVAQLDNLQKFLNEKAKAVEGILTQNLQNFENGALPGAEVPAPTELLDFDIDQSLDSIVENFVLNIQAKLAVSMTMIEPIVVQPFFWSEKLADQDVDIMNEGKTVRKINQNGWSNVMMDRPLSEGKHSWKLKIDRFVRCHDFFIGVSRDTDKYNKTPSTAGDIDAYAYLATVPDIRQKNVNKQPFGHACRNGGEVITVTLEFENGRGQVSYDVNGTDYGIAFSNLVPPLYPYLSLYCQHATVSIID